MDAKSRAPIITQGRIQRRAQCELGLPRPRLAAPCADGQQEHRLCDCRHRYLGPCGAGLDKFRLG